MRENLNEFKGEMFIVKEYNRTMLSQDISDENMICRSKSCIIIDY